MTKTSPPIGTVVKEALRGERSHAREPLLVLSNMQDECRVVIVWDPAAKGHKYIDALDDTGAAFLVVMPLTMIELHKHILAHIATAIERDVYCPGGGFVTFKGDTAEVHGASQDFGPGDHRTASKRLTSLWRTR